MDSEQNVGGRDRLVRAVLTAVLSIVAVRWLKAGKRGRGLLAGAGALGFGFTATTGYCGVNDTLDVDTTSGSDGDVASVESTDVETDTSTVGTTTTGVGDENDTASVGTDSGTAVDTPSQGIACAACGEPFEPGQRRGPNEHDEIVHETCA